jgi:hypothetical protein
VSSPASQYFSHRQYERYSTRDCTSAWKSIDAIDCGSAGVAAQSKPSRTPGG